MKRYRYKQLVLVASTFCFTIVLAGQSTLGQNTKQIVIQGFGSSSCGLWTEVRANRHNPSDLRFLQAQEWISGYLSAYNAYVSPSGNVAGTGKTDQEGMYVWIDQYCQGHPTTYFVTALEQFIRAQ